MELVRLEQLKKFVEIRIIELFYYLGDVVCGDHNNHFSPLIAPIVQKGYGCSFAEKVFLRLLVFCLSFQHVIRDILGVITMYRLALIKSGVELELSVKRGLSADHTSGTVQL